MHMYIIFDRIHKSLLTLEREFESYNLKTNFNSKQTDVIVALETIANLDRAVLCHQVSENQLFSLTFSISNPPPRSEAKMGTGVTYNPYLAPKNEGF